MWGEFYKNRLDFYLIYIEAQFHAAIEKAQDKDYAREFMCMNLFRGNAILPYDTVFWNTLFFKFVHYQKMGESDYLQLAAADIPAVREQAREALESGYEYILRKQQWQLDLHYKSVVDAELYTVDEILQHEQFALNLTDEQVIDMLAYFQSVRILSITLDPLLSEVKENQFHKAEKERAEEKFKAWTRPQQILLMKYILEAAGITSDNTPKLEYPRFFLVMMRLDHTNVGYSDIYKLIRQELKYAAKKTVDRDLRIVLSFFDSVPDKKVPQLIEAAIKKVDYQPKFKSIKK